MIVIDDIAPRWNHPVDYDPPLADDDQSLLRYTAGGPYFYNYRDFGYADLWVHRTGPNDQHRAPRRRMTPGKESPFFQGSIDKSRDGGLLRHTGFCGALL